jgi:hypothetical protein
MLNNNCQQETLQIIFLFAEPMSCMVYSEGPGYFEINQSRDIIVQT